MIARLRRAVARFDRRVDASIARDLSAPWLRPLDRVLPTPEAKVFALGLIVLLLLA